MSAVDLLTIVGFIASVASLVLAVVAIWLAIVFYRFSAKAAEDSADNAKEIAASVERLEKLFDTLYTDTFSIVRDTVGDMRKHIWHKDDSVTPTAIEQAEAEQAILDQVASASVKLGMAAEKSEELVGLLTPTVKESVGEVASRPAERDDVLAYLRWRHRARKGGATLREISRAVARDESVVSSGIVGIVFDLREEGLVTWEGDDNRLSDRTRIRFVPSGLRASDPSHAEDEEHAEKE